MKVTDENFEKEINAADKLVMVDFFATWCEPCSILGPMIERVAEQFKNDVILIKANVDFFQATAQKYKVEKIPTIVLFKNGKSINSFVGVMPEKSIKDWLENVIKKNKDGEK